MVTTEPSFSTFRFVQSSGQPENRKRIASKACESCRRRKKRCFHAPENQEDSAHGAEHGGAGGRAANDTPSGQTVTSTFESQRGEHSLSGVQRVAYQAPQTGDTATSLSVHSATSHPRFIGDLNPEVELLTATTPARQPKNNVGVWHTESADQPHPDSGLNLSSPLSLFYGSSGSIQSQLQNIAKTQCLDICPCWQDFEILEALYFENIHPILPCVDRDTYWSSPVDSPTKALLQQIICLMTCPSPSVRGLLRLPGTEGLLSPADFARKIVAAMRLSIELALVSDKAVVIQALMAMSLIAYGRESLELTPQFFIRAVQHGYTIGLHQPGDAQRNDRTAALFCSVWSMDRLHAAMQGRPVIMHEADMAKVPKEEASNQQPEFKVLISIAMLLDKVIGLYRPGASSVEISDDDFPSFEEILEECSATDSPSHLIATLELFYHAVAILSCRYSSGPRRDSHNGRNNRQASSAMQILSIMEDSNVSETLVLMPWHSKALTHRTRARKRLAQAYKHLLPSGQVFWSAAFMAEMAGKILAERHVDESEPAQESTRGPLAPQNGVQALLENESNPPNASLDSGQPLYDSGTDWNLDDLDTILEGNLDPSISWYPQDLQELFGLDLQ
ncbi:hypothetical protein M409DRAFT_67821 [Zasmidium cellare ATCC 36951]|uniref:Xylanolytic transcriptional activator regulatory domain-containing protein n=1 Tax=Zasmidium cellare ATCC 36951 TaxID=1080233 RepID=A0A6A6CC17_ZASCE|nr:uncharacterized protein M409DRAFT_67821 [Zasmidium cellare ATCC 36951]KAF2164724.1 hypothetical protein M409DRAFT_67821 [Zasmidium cellare ATCC 36951]